MMKTNISIYYECEGRVKFSEDRLIARQCRCIRHRYRDFFIYDHFGWEVQPSFVTCQRHLIYAT